MSAVAGIAIRPAVADDYAAWLPLWHGYCAALGGTVPEAVTMATWRRILDPAWAISCLVACAPDGALIGFATFVLHPNTWSDKSLCYLEDLFVAAEARGSGAGRLLIEALVTLGRSNGWHRVYWHTRETNYRARTLYDRMVARTDYIRYDIDL